MCRHLAGPTGCATNPVVGTYSAGMAWSTPQTRREALAAGGALMVAGLAACSDRRARGGDATVASTTAATDASPAVAPDEVYFPPLDGEWLTVSAS